MADTTTGAQAYLLRGTADADMIRAEDLAIFDWKPAPGDQTAQVWGASDFWTTPSYATGQVVFEGVSAASPFQVDPTHLSFAFDGGAAISDPAGPHGGPWSWDPETGVLDPHALQGFVIVPSSYDPPMSATHFSWTLRQDGAEFDGERWTMPFGSQETGQWVFRAVPTIDVRAGEGADTVIGGAGGDRLLGEGGADQVEGGDGNDAAYGGDGDDTLDGGMGGDVLDGQRGDDLILGGGGNDVASGGSGNDTLRGGAGDDVLYGHSGDDLLEGAAGADLLVGGASRTAGGGYDTVSYASSAAAVRVDLAAGTATGGDAVGDKLFFIAGLDGSGFADRLSGDAVANHLSGRGGDDTLAGAAGDDTLSGGLGSDLLDGGAGVDTATYAGRRAGYQVTLSEDGQRAWVRDIDPRDGDEGTDALTSMERLRFADDEVDVAPDQPFGHRWIFAANDGINGNQLWVTDGTSEGTRLVRDLFPHGVTVASIFDQQPLGDGRVIFRIWDGIHSGQIWVTNGTTAGTHLFVTNGSPVSGSEKLGVPLQSGEVLLALSDPAHGTEPWVTDGTAEGTHLAADIAPGVSSSYPSDFTRLASGQTLFTAMNGPAGSGGLWISDGTAVGTELVKTFGAEVPNTFLSNITVAEHGKLALFTVSVNDYAAPEQLWASDGTAGGTHLIEQFSKTGFYNSLFDFVVLDSGEVLFTLISNASGTELWGSDGTAAGTHMIANLSAGLFWSDPGNIVDLGGGRALFTAHPSSATSATGNAQLMVTDGTATGTHAVLGSLPWGTAGGIGNLAALGDKQAVFTISVTDKNGHFSEDLWVSDGTSAGTHLVRNLLPEASDSASSAVMFRPISSDQDGSGRALFTLDDGLHGRELWITDGTAAGTHMVDDINPEAGSDSQVGNVAEVW